MCSLYGVYLRVGSVARNGRLCVHFLLGKQILLCLGRVNAALGEWHGETWFRMRT